MRQEFIDALHCPYSGTRLTRSYVSVEHDGEIEYGIAISEAGEFPIIGGILRLKIDEYRQPLVSLVRKNEARRALLGAIEPFSYGRQVTIVNFLDRAAKGIGLDSIIRASTALRGRLYDVLTDPTLTFKETVSKVKSSSWAKWQIYRFSMPAFLSVYPFLHLTEAAGPILDFGCGAGQASFLISRRTGGSKLTCADYQFSPLYLARKFFVHDANFVCLDGNYMLPFASSYFSVVFSHDTLHLIDSKVGLSQEFERIVTEKGLIIMPHLHNKLSPIKFGKSLSPDGYSALFSVDKRIMPEDLVVREFIQNDSLDLERKWTPQELQSATKGLSIVATKDSSFFRRDAQLWQRHIDRIMQPLINPLYRVSGQAGEWLLNKEDPDSMGKFSPTGDGYLPGTVSLALASLDRNALLALKVSDPAKFGALARQFILIDAPNRFE